LAISAWQQTDGWFDPTVLDALEAAGYDRTHEEVVGRDLAARPARPVPGPDAITLDARLGEVVLPAGVHLDLGGIGKGHTADLVATGLLTRGATGALVNMGGDLRAVGRPPVGDVWVVATDATPPVEVAITAGAVATSTTTKRRWTVDDRPMHHLIDPHTGAPSTSDLATVTIVAGTAAWAEVLAKVVLLAGVDVGTELLTRSGVTGIATAHDGTVTRLAGFDAYERLRG
jgi:thiamine biosynthesis lipoprotein